ncbi:hypothetical protein DFQ29_003821, partial [Apophysomyces sp. BC1021]
MQTGMKSLVAGLSIMKSMCTELQQKVIHAKKHAHDGKYMATLIVAEGTTEPARGAEAWAWERDLHHF